MTKKAFAVVYRFYLQSSKEKQYLKSWNQVSHFFIQKRGAIASTLHKTEEGYWLAYSKWPDKKTRDASWQADGIEMSLPKDIQDEIAFMKSCLNLDKETFPEICMEVALESY